MPPRNAHENKTHGLDNSGGDYSRPNANSLASSLLAFSFTALALFPRGRRPFRSQRLGRVVSNALDNPEAFGTALTEDQTVARGEVFGSLDEPERNVGPVARADERAVYVDNGTGLGDGADVKHGLVFSLNRGRVGEDEYFCRNVSLATVKTTRKTQRLSQMPLSGPRTFSNELAVDFRGWHCVRLWQDHHPLSNLFSPYLLQRERGGLPR